jgi:hypothetical protein
VTPLRFAHFALPKEAEPLRQEVRAFLRESLATWTAAQRAQSWDGFNREFSRQVGARGWIGMTWPKAYGGRERSALDRYVVMEEMLYAGAPVSFHWIADRQSGPLLLRFGTEQQRRAILPRIANRLILGGEVITGAEALEFGIVQWTCSRVHLTDRARELAAHYASIPRAAVAEIKKCLGSADERSRDGYEEEIIGTRRLYNNPETRRRVAHFLNKSAA